MILARRRSSCGSSRLSAPNTLSRGLIVNVVAARERRGQRLVARQVREHAQLDLRVVGRDQHVTRIGDEGAANLPADLGADRDVLQVRIAAAQASGRGHRLADLRVHAAGLRIHQRRQRVDVGALQLRQAAPVEDEAADVVLRRQLLEHFDGRRRRARRARCASAPAAAASRTGSRRAASASRC